MYIGYDNIVGVMVMTDFSVWVWLECDQPFLDCNCCVWMVPGTVDPSV